MIKILIILVIISIKASLSQAGNGLLPAGARSSAMGNASVTHTDGFALFNNIAGISEINTFTALFYYDNRFGVPSLDHMGTGLIIPMSYGSIGMSVFRHGDEWYNEHLLGLGYGHRIGIMSLGVKVNYHQYLIEGFGTRTLGTIELGGVAELSEQLFFGAHIFNINQAMLSKHDSERLPTLMKAGLAYKPSAKVLLCVESEKDLIHTPRFKAGLEYELVQFAYARTGVATNPYTNHLGVGFLLRNLALDYVLNHHHFLGISHHLSVILQIAQK
jgi:hypothetical protein